MKSSFILALLLLLTACQPAADEGSKCDSTTRVCSSNSQLMPEEGDDEVPEHGVPTNATTFDTNLSLRKFSADQEDKVLEAAELIRQVVASEEFKDAVLNHTYNGQKTFVDSQGLTNAQIYNKFLQGAEKLTPAKNNAMDVELELYYENTTTIGYTYPNTRRIWMNTKYFDRYTAAQVAGNLTHEWLHKLGFGHASSSTASRPYSVPYAIGYIMVRLINEL